MTAMQYIVNSVQFDSFWDFMLGLLMATGVSLLFYGIYILLFILAIRTLKRRKTSGMKLLMGVSCVMAVLATTQMAVNIALAVFTARLVQQVVHSQLLNANASLATLLVLDTVQAITTGINLFVTDFLFLYRCYVIWGFQRKIIVLPTLLMLSTVVVAILRAAQVQAQTRSVVDVRILLSLAAATNLVLTGLTASRILWVRRAARHVGLNNTLRGRYSTVLRVILESGAIYCTVAIFLVIAASLSDEKIYNIAVGMADQLLNIIPMITVVYVGQHNKDDNPAAGSTHKVTSKQHAARRLRPDQHDQAWRVLEIKRQGDEEKDVEVV
ncbi:hypothetical protein B0H19DRAFT_1384663 [Mycena capillaripes]|nr:hypothetical protein B0H19DRAFT_1384663 [Mycena capillaripes]